MKTRHFLLLIIATLVIAIVVSLRSTAQPTNSPHDRGVIGKYEQLVFSLSKRGDSNTVTEVAGLISAMHAEQNATEVGFTVAILDSLRSGRTNDALQLLETRLNGALITFGVSPASERDAKYDKILKMAKEYRSKYPHKSGISEIDTGVARAFDSLPR